MYARDRFPDTKKTVFQSRAMLGRYCNGAPQKSPNWGTEFGAENAAIVEGLEGHRMTDHPGFGSGGPSAAYNTLNE